MEDKEIVKALKELLEIMLCEGDLQRSATISKALDLINLQKAENERLKAPTNDWLVRGISPEQLEQEKIQVWKAEAYKEFAKELKHKAINIGVNDSIVSTYVIDNTLKELVGEDDG